MGSNLPHAFMICAAYYNVTFIDSCVTEITNSIFDTKIFNVWNYKENSETIGDDYWKISKHCVS